MSPSREDVLTTLYSLVSAEQLRMYAVSFARFPREHWPDKGASLAVCAAVLVDTASPEVWGRFVDALAEPYKRRPADLALLRRWVPGGPPPRRAIYAAVALDGSGVWAIGDSAEEARAGAVDRREFLRDVEFDCDFPPPETDSAWLDTLTLVTLSGTTEGLRALITSMETGDPVAPWCPADLWDSGEVTP